MDEANVSEISGGRPLAPMLIFLFLFFIFYFAFIADDWNFSCGVWPLACSLGFELFHDFWISIPPPLFFPSKLVATALSFVSGWFFIYLFFLLFFFMLPSRGRLHPSEGILCSLACCSLLFLSSFLWSAVLAFGLGASLPTLRDGSSWEWSTSAPPQREFCVSFMPILSELLWMGLCSTSTKPWGHVNWDDAEASIKCSPAAFCTGKLLAVNLE